MIPPMIPGNASAALIPNRPNRDAKAFSGELLQGENISCI